MRLYYDDKDALKLSLYFGVIKKCLRVKGYGDLYISFVPFCLSVFSVDVFTLL